MSSAIDFCTAYSATGTAVSTSFWASPQRSSTLLTERVRVQTSLTEP